MLNTAIKDKLVLRFSSACFEPHFCHMLSEKKPQILLYTSHLLFYHGEICVSNGQQMSYLRKRETKANFFPSNYEGHNMN